jgi:hypothetical protein
VNKVIGFIGLLLLGGVGVVLLAKSPKVKFETDSDGTPKPPESAVAPKPHKEMLIDRSERLPPGRNTVITSSVIQAAKDIQVPVPSKLTPSVIQAAKDIQVSAPSKFTPSIIQAAKDIQVPTDVRPAVIPQPIKGFVPTPMDVRPAVIPQPVKGFAVPLENPKFRDPVKSKDKNFVLPSAPEPNFRKLKGF